MNHLTGSQGTCQLLLAIDANGVGGPELPAGSKCSSAWQDVLSAVSGFGLTSMRCGVASCCAMRA